MSGWMRWLILEVLEDNWSVIVFWMFTTLNGVEMIVVHIMYYIKDFRIIIVFHWAH